MIAELAAIADRCDGVRCDMAMLLQPADLPADLGRPRAARRRLAAQGRSVLGRGDPAIKRRHPGFTFVAEVYWDMEWELQQAGFDFTYDKRLYDRLVAPRSARRCAST